MLSNLCYLNQVPGLAVCDRGGGLERRPGVCGQGEDALVNMLSVIGMANGNELSNESE